MKEPNPTNYTILEYKTRLKEYKKQKALIEAKQIMAHRVYMKVCENCKVPMYNVPKARRFCLDRNCNIAKRRKSGQLLKSRKK